MPSTVLRVSAAVRARARPNFAAQHLAVARYFATHAAAIEGSHAPSKKTFAPPEYSHFCWGAVVFSVMAAEADVYDLMRHPDRYKGDATVTPPFSAADQRREVLERYALVYEWRIGKSLETGKGPAQSFKTLVKLRNAIVHAKSEWRDDANLSRALRASCGTRFSENPYLSGPAYFPDKCTSAAAAQWAVRTTEVFVRGFSKAICARVSV